MDLKSENKVQFADLKTEKVLGVPISLLPTKSVADWIDRSIAFKTQNLIVTADATALVIAHQNPRFREILNSASLITADGVGVLWALKRKGVVDPPKVSGVDLAQLLVENSSRSGHRIFFLGAAPGIAELAADRMRLRFPGCNIVGTHHGYFPAEDDSIVAEEIAKTQPDILLIAMGMPRQEEFFEKTKHITKVSIGMGVGGTFDVFSGKTRRAPKLVQKLHMEWLWRLALNPTKFAKVRMLPRFVRLVLTSKS